MPARSWAGFNPAGKGGVVLRALFNPPRKLTHEQCLRMSIMDYCRLYRVSPAISKVPLPPYRRESVCHEHAA